MRIICPLSIPCTHIASCVKDSLAPFVITIRTYVSTIVFRILSLHSQNRTAQHKTARYDTIRYDTIYMHALRIETTCAVVLLEFAR